MENLAKPRRLKSNHRLPESLRTPLPSSSEAILHRISEPSPEAMLLKDDSHVLLAKSCQFASCHSMESSLTSSSVTSSVASSLSELRKQHRIALHLEHKRNLKILYRYFSLWVAFVQRQKIKQKRCVLADTFCYRKLLSKNYKVWKLKYRGITEKKFMATERKKLNLELRQRRNLLHSAFSNWRGYVEICRAEEAMRFKAEKMRRNILLGNYFRLWRKRKGEKMIRMQLEIGQFRLKWCHIKRAALLRGSFTWWKFFVQRAQRERSIKLLVQNSRTTRLLREYFRIWSHCYIQKNQFRHNLALEFHTRLALRKENRILRQYFSRWKQQYIRAKTNKALCVESVAFYREKKVDKFFKIWFVKYEEVLKCKQNLADKFLHTRQLVKRRALLRVCLHGLLNYKLACYRKRSLHYQAVSWERKTGLHTFYYLWKRRWFSNKITHDQTCLALWHWSSGLKRKVLLAWIKFARENREQRLRHCEAAIYRKIFIQRNSIRNWILFADSIVESCAAGYDYKEYKNYKYPKSVYKCAEIWLRKWHRRKLCKHVSDERQKQKSIQSDWSVLQILDNPRSVNDAGKFKYNSICSSFLPERLTDYVTCKALEHCDSREAKTITNFDNCARDDHLPWRGPLPIVGKHSGEIKNDFYSKKLINSSTFGQQRSAGRPPYHYLAATERQHLKTKMAEKASQVNDPATTRSSCLEPLASELLEPGSDTSGKNFPSSNYVPDCIPIAPETQEIYDGQENFPGLAENNEDVDQNSSSAINLSEPQVLNTRSYSLTKVESSEQHEATCSLPKSVSEAVLASSNRTPRCPEFMKMSVERLGIDLSHFESKSSDFEAVSNRESLELKQLDLLDHVSGPNSKPDQENSEPVNGKPVNPIEMTMAVENGQSLERVGSSEHPIIIHCDNKLEDFMDAFAEGNSYLNGNIDVPMALSNENYNGCYSKNQATFSVLASVEINSEMLMKPEEFHEAENDPVPRSSTPDALKETAKDFDMVENSGTQNFILNDSNSQVLSEIAANLSQNILNESFEILSKAMCNQLNYEGEQSDQVDISTQTEFLQYEEVVDASKNAIMTHEDNKKAVCTQTDENEDTLCCVCKSLLQETTKDDGQAAYAVDLNNKTEGSSENLVGAHETTTSYAASGDSHGSRYSVELRRLVVQYKNLKSRSERKQNDLKRLVTDISNGSRLLEESETQRIIKLKAEVRKMNKQLVELKHSIKSLNR